MSKIEVLYGGDAKVHLNWTGFQDQHETNEQTIARAIRELAAYCIQHYIHFENAEYSGAYRGEIPHTIRVRGWGRRIVASLPTQRGAITKPEDHK